MHPSDYRLRTPQPQGLYHSRNEHDACGMVWSPAFAEKKPRHHPQGLEVLINLTIAARRAAIRRRATRGHSDSDSPRLFCARVRRTGHATARAGAYGVAMCFLPWTAQPPAVRGRLRAHRPGRGLTVIGWRDTPVNGIAIGRERAPRSPTSSSCFWAARRMMKTLRAAALSRSPPHGKRMAARNRGPRGIFLHSFAFLSHHRLQGLMLAPQIEKFYFELADPLVTSALCVVHQRFPPTPFPVGSCPPLRYVSHNGEINTIRGNVSWMNARQSVLESPLYDGKIDDLYPVIMPAQRLGFTGQRVEFLFQSGRTLPHVMAMLIPKPGPAIPTWTRTSAPFTSTTLSDGTLGRAGGHRLHRRRVIGATLDRNGCAPAATSSPRTIWWCWPLKPACSTCRPRIFARRADSSGTYVPGRYRRKAHRLRRRDQAAVGRPPALREVAAGSR